MLPNVIYYDNHLLVLYKPSGLLTQPSPIESESLENWGKEWLKRTFRKPGNVFLHAVHRLDRPVSGMVLFARTSKALSRLQDEIRRGNFSKIYLTIIQGRPKEDAGIFEDWLIHESYHAKEGKQKEKNAKRCELQFRVINGRKPYTLMQVLLKTGRYHQIRLQFSKRGLPIWGDRKYGSDLTLSNPMAIALHHAFLEIIHPIEKKKMAWHSPPPPDWPLSLPADFVFARDELILP